MKTVRSPPIPGRADIRFITCALTAAVLCARCANTEPEVHTDPTPDKSDDWRIVGSDINWEDTALVCERHYEQKTIESAYEGCIDVEKLCRALRLSA